MESARKEEVKTPPERVKDLLQNVLNEMNDYIRNDYAKVKSPTSERLKSIKNIATAIYKYYKQELLINDFDSNLSDLFTAVDEAERNKKTPELAKLKLLPELKDFYTPEALPASLHNFYRIIGLIQTEMAAMPSLLRNASALRDHLIRGIKGYDTLAQELGANIYLVAHLQELSYIEMVKRPVDFANCLYEALTTGRIYQDGVATASLGNKTYHVAFCTSKAEAENIIKSDYPNHGCFGVEFSFTLRKTTTDPIGQYIPKLDSVHRMDVWNKNATNQYPIECHATRSEFVLARQQSGIALKKQ